jgi:NADH:ubiquinone oxidoreductase subunit E
MSRYDDLFDLLEENNDTAEEILEYHRKLEKKIEEVLALLRELQKKS